MLVGFSMGGTVSSVVADEPSVQGVVGIAPWLPHQFPLDALAGKRLRVLHSSLDRALPGIPGSLRELPARGSSTLSARVHMGSPP